MAGGGFYNNMAGIGKVALKWEAIIGFVIAIGCLVGGLYMTFKPLANDDDPDKKNKMLVGLPFLGAAVIVTIISLVMLRASKGTGKVSRFMQASSGARLLF